MENQMEKSNVLAFKKQKLDTFEGILKGYQEKIVRIDATENLQVLDLKQSNIFHLTLRRNFINISFDNLPNPEYSYSCNIIVKQDAIGGRKIVFPENVYWSFGEVAILTTKPNRSDLITLITFDGGESYFASHSLANLGK